MELRLLGFAMIFVTVVHISGFFVALGPTELISITFVWQLSIGIFVGIFALAVSFEYVKKIASSIYTEMSDAMKQRVEESLVQKDDTWGSPDHIPHEFQDFRFVARVAMKEFASHSELPLLPGRFGPAILIGMNFLLTVIMARAQII